jgi:hypothetical protein
MSEYGRQDWSKVSANPIVDWGGLAKGFSEQLATQEQARIAKRKEIDDNTSTALKDLQNYTVGNNANVNSVITSGSDAYTTLLKNQYDQVQKGLADPRQFQLLLKNSQDSFGYLKKVGETWNQRADELQKRSNEGVNSLIEIEKAKLDAGLEQFQNVRIMPNSDGQMYMYHNNDDGSVNKSIPPTSISSLLNPANTKVDKVDVAKSTAPIAKTVSDYIKRSGSRSLGEFTNNPVGRKSYDEFADGAANTLTATPIQTASILADGMGKLLSWTEEDYKKNPGSVYMKMVNGVMTPQITPEQYKQAKDHIKETLESQIVYEEKQQYQPERPQIVKAPEEEGKGKKAPVVVTLNDVVPSNPLVKTTAEGKKVTGGYKFILKQPLVDESTGVKQSLRAISIDPTDGSLTMDLETGETTKGAKGTATERVSTKSKVLTKGGKVKPAEIDKINTFVRKIYNPETQQYLQDWNELYDMYSGSISKLKGTQKPTRSGSNFDYEAYYNQQMKGKK